MRALTVQELELVAGGLGTTTSGGSTITVTGHPTSTWWPTFTYTTTGGGGGGGGGVRAVLTRTKSPRRRTKRPASIPSRRESIFTISITR